jgi:hypothetical protein
MSPFIATGWAGLSASAAGAEPANEPAGVVTAAKVAITAEKMIFLFKIMVLAGFAMALNAAIQPENYVDLANPVQFPVARTF